MRCSCGLYRPAVLTVLALFAAGLGSASSLSYSGTFSHDNDVQLFSVYLANPGTVTIQTWSFGGTWGPNQLGHPETNAAGQSVAAGGIFPFLTLFDPNNGEILYTSNQLGCGECRPDPVTTYSYDAYIYTQPLAAGFYELALTVYDNVPVSAYWQDGLSNSGNPYFTETFFNDYNSRTPPYTTYGAYEHAPFLLYSSGEKRNGNWDVDIIGVDNSNELPEPASLVLFIAGLVLLFVPRALGLRRVS